MEYKCMQCNNSDIDDITLIEILPTHTTSNNFPIFNMVKNWWTTKNKKYIKYKSKYLDIKNKI